MTRYLFDCETNGLLDTLTTIHSLVLKDADTGVVTSCADKPGYVPIVDGLRMLMEADEIIGHNILKFDIPALAKVHPWFKPKGKVTDTLILSRLIYADLRDIDFTRLRKGKQFPGRLVGSHSLEAWGYRLGNLKLDYGKATHNTKDDDAWAYWSEEMQVYCVQDVEVTYDLWQRLVAKGFDPFSVWIEHEFQRVIALQEEHGIHFDVARARDLYVVLASRRNELEQALQATFLPWWVSDGKKTPARTVNYKDVMRPSTVEGATFTRVKLMVFNPASRDHIANRLITLKGWQPEEFTKEGKPKVDDTILAKLPWPEAKLIAEYLMVQKRLGQLAEGDQAWLKLERNGRIYGRVITNGAVTGRCTHSNPNVAQVPSVGAPYGKECRSLFYAPKGWKMMGADASGLELRCLGHYMARYDDGAYIHTLLNGDIHWANTQAMGLTSEDRDEHSKLHKLYRDGSKTFIYGFLYGAGDEKAGRIVYDIIVKAKALGLPYGSLLKTFFGGNEAPTEEDFKRAGKRLKSRFLKAVPALKRLREDIAAKVTSRGYLIGIDGRRLTIRSDHAALNTLLQSAGAVAVKLATVLLYQDLCNRGYIFGKDYANVAHVHDEVQLIVREGLEDEIGNAAVEAFRKAGEMLKFRCPLDGEYKVGQNWCETH